MRKVCALALFYITVARGSAVGGPTRFAWLTTTEVLPDRSAELDARISDENDKGPLHVRATSVELAPAIGLSDCVELRLPVEMTWRSELGARTDFTLSRFGADVRYGGSHGALARVFRFALSRDVVIRNLGRIELDAAASYERGPIQLLVDGGLTFEANPGGVHFELRPGAGISVRVKPEVRIGAEVYAVHSFDSSAQSWAVIGPNLAWTHGRFWFAGSFGIGVQNISSAARVVWGIGF